MHTDICTHPGKLKVLRRCAALILIAGFMAITASAQNGRTNSSSGQAVLHIQVNVVPIVMLPMQKKAAESTFITYSLKNEPLNSTVTSPFCSATIKVASYALRNGECDKHAGLPRRGVPWPPGVVSPVAPVGNNARTAVPEGPSESLTQDCVLSRRGRRAFIRRVAGRRNSVISGRDKQACLRLSSRK